jgi:formate dehydrogenase
MAKVLCVLYDDPVDGYPPAYARDGIPKIEGYPGGQSAPTPEAIDFTPGELLGCVSGELGLRPYLEAAGHELVVTSDKEGPDSEFERHLADAEVVISQPFFPAYLTAERIARAPRLKLALTAGIGSDHVDLQAASAAGMTPHISGTSLSAQARYAAGTREILECWLAGRPIRDEYLIVAAGGLAGTGAHSYKL